MYVVVEIMGGFGDMTPWFFKVKFLLGMIRKHAFGPSDKLRYLAKWGLSWFCIVKLTYP